MPPLQRFFRRVVRGFRAQDAVWLVLFGGLMLCSETPDISEITLLVLLAALQILEPKLSVLSGARAKVLWNVIKLLAAYLFIGYTGGVGSSYYLILLLPVISAATTLGNIVTLMFAMAACGAYLSFLLYIDWSLWILEPGAVLELARRVIFIAMAGNLAIALAEYVRVQSGNYKAVAEQLVEANRSLREAEAAVRRSDRLAALGQLSAGLAHELRNPLGTMKASAEMLVRALPADNAVAQEVAGFIVSEVDRTNSLVTRFLEFARPLKPRRALSDIGQVIDRAVAQVERETSSRVTIYKNFSPDLRPFAFDAELMERVFYNLLLNAAQATEAGGAVTIKTRPLEGTAEISVIDRGSGIPPELAESIFNPFVTTKPSGVGLGLAIVSKIVDEHGGKITVESEPAKGSVFRVYLPLAPPSAS